MLWEIEVELEEGVRVNVGASAPNIVRSSRAVTHSLTGNQRLSVTYNVHDA